MAPIVPQSAPASLAPSDLGSPPRNDKKPRRAVQKIIALRRILG
jgi:hypothetical protein